MPPGVLKVRGFIRDVPDWQPEPSGEGLYSAEGLLVSTLGGGGWCAGDPPLGRVASGCGVGTTFVGCLCGAFVGCLIGLPALTFLGCGFGVGRRCGLRRG